MPNHEVSTGAKKLLYRNKREKKKNNTKISKNKNTSGYQTNSIDILIQYISSTTAEQDKKTGRGIKKGPERDIGSSI